MFEDSIDWKLVINDERNALLKQNGSIDKPINAIESDHIFLNQVIGVYVDSNTAPLSWYGGGEVLQAFLVPWGVGYAQGQREKIVLRRYHLFRFNQFPTSITGDTRYLISYVPPNYFTNVRLRVWEFVGQSGTNLEQIQRQITAIDAKLS